MNTTETILARILPARIYFKCAAIIFMAFVLWIPTVPILELIRERAARQKEAVANVQTKWAGQQTVTGPILMVPYTETIPGDKGIGTMIRKTAFFMPDKLDIQSVVFPEKRHRGIYEVAVYRTEINISGKFAPLPISQLEIPPGNLLWNEARVLFRTEDNIKGFNDDLVLNWNGKNIVFEPPAASQTLFPNAFSLSAPFSKEDAGKEHFFRMKFNMNGSEKLLFSPVARENKISMASDWPDPGFTGVKLPDTREVSADGFVATWKFMNRTLPAVWKNANYQLSEISIGTNLLLPVDSYDKTERSVKYALLCIFLTFACFFLVETIYKRPLHLVHYGLAGLALVLFYSLLLSISEYLGFNLAYVIAGAATISLVAWFVGSILKSLKLAMFISLVLTIVYGYIFTIIQLQDYSLLMGSVGLFLALGIIMFFSRKLHWTNTTDVQIAEQS